MITSKWMVGSIAALLLWSYYPIASDAATRIHGERINMVLVMAAYVLIVGAMALFGGIEGLEKVTARSLTIGLISGLTSAGGVLLMFYALSHNPSPSNTPVIFMITGAYPAVAVIIAAAMGSSTLTSRDWCGILLVAAGLIILNGKS